MFNRIKEFLDNRPDPVGDNPHTSAYRFWQDTGLSRSTAYRLYNDISYIPTGDVLDKICSTYRIKPGIILDWKPDDEPSLVSNVSDSQSSPSTNEVKSEKGDKSHQKDSQSETSIVIIPHFPESA